MLTRRVWLQGSLGGALSMFLPHLLRADTVAGLRDQLEKGLKLRRDLEFAFVASVIAAVENGGLPRVEVEKVFFWARRKKPYPFPYFERRMRMVAEEFGVEL